MQGVDVDISKVLDEYGKKVKQELERFIPRKFDERTLSSLLGEPLYKYELESINKSILQPFWDLIDRGGKRWRPALMLIVYEALGGDIEEILPLTIIPETIHNGTLAVDDVEDDSDFRRGKPCIHKIYGVDVAINMGNTMYFLPLLILSKINIPEHKKMRILEEYVKTMVELSFGQAMDIAWHRGLVDEIDEEQYLQMTLFKTGTLARFSIKIATIMADASKEVEEIFSRFGESIAIAFQIQDDILNIVGDESKYGKEIGGDIKEGKRTLVVVRALKSLPKERADRLKEILNMRTGNPELIKEAITLIKESGSIEYARSFCNQLVSKAWSQLENVLKDSRAKKNLKALADFLIMREY
ncbi:MAG: polyprenyl synthetase family protein [Aigarchaeota archaeon]|nr:polyprenyl synthetase family protein [Aigarchaeota archaeon]MCX8192837.1 polyprenyl synthetase family protein [Nitrososphaeria archaeon]MDW7986081.1 polyprenyl synthetase family protein [Nitrososphaerota archaeon]